MKVIIQIFFLLFLVIGVSQELPPVINFDPNGYKAGNQNWMIAQGDNKNIYVANSRGLLEYTGAKWSLYPMPNNTVVRAVEVVDNRIYTGAYMEIGYWERDEKGLLNYSSLLPLFPSGVRDGEQFWNIHHLENMLIFQSFEGIYLYDLNTSLISKLKTTSSSIRNLFKVNGEIFFQVTGEGLFTIKRNQAQLEISPSILRERELMHITGDGNKLILITRSGQILSWDGEFLEKSMEGPGIHLKNKSVFSAITLEDKSILIGTVEDGIYYVDKNGQLLLHFNQQNGLMNNTILALFQDVEGNIWSGLDNGISVINLDSPITMVQDIYGHLGSVYASFYHGEYFYLGTNQGLYYKKNEEEKFNFIEGTNGQVWSLQEIGGILYCGHNNGTFIVEESKARKIFDQTGTWVVKEYMKDPNYLLQGHYNGISLLKKEEEDYVFVGLLNDFPHSSKFIISEPNGEIWVGNEHKGVFKLEINKSDLSVSSIQNFAFDGIPGITSSIFKFNDTLYYSAIDQLFQYDEEENAFNTGSSLADLLEETNLNSGKIVNTEDNKIWGFTDNAIFNIQINHLGGGYSLNPVYLPNDLKNITLGYENISSINGDYLLGVSNGYLKINDVREGDIQTDIRIDNIYTSALDEDPRRIELNGAEPFHYKTNNVTFNFSIPEYRKFVIPLYSYRLLGLSSNWSSWTSVPSAGFKNLRFGEYEFQVKGRLGDVETDPVIYKFEISRPWYLSMTAIAVYLLFFLGILWLVNKSYKRKHLKMIRENEKELKMRNLEAEKKIMELQNEQLEKDMFNKNKELAISTMSLIRKNEFLTSVREKLKNSKSPSEITSVIRTIDKDISEEDNWKFFKEAFNNADKDFFKKIKSHHPNLTSNDLKLCAYLRLNLTSKEIAPLLNISVKSVEIKRYRLRKKMNLLHEENLVDYILEV